MSTSAFSRSFWVGGRVAGDRLALGDLLVEPIDLRLPGRVGIHPGLDGGRPQRLDRGQAPDQDRERQQGERHPGPGDASVGQGVLGRGVCLGGRVETEIGVVGEPPLAPGLPEPEHDHAREQAGDGGDRGRPARTRRSSTRANWTAANVPPIDQQGRPDGQRLAPADHRPDQPERDDQRERAARSGPRWRSSASTSSPVTRAQGADRRADRPPGDGGGVGDQAEQGRLERLGTPGRPGTPPRSPPGPRSRPPPR